MLISHAAQPNVPTSSHFHVTDPFPPLIPLFSHTCSFPSHLIHSFSPPLVFIFHMSCAIQKCSSPASHNVSITPGSNLPQFNMWFSVDLPWWMSLWTLGLRSLLGQPWIWVLTCLWALGLWRWAHSRLMALSMVLEGAGQGLDWAFPTACCLSDPLRVCRWAFITFA